LVERSTEEKKRKVVMELEIGVWFIPEVCSLLFSLCPLWFIPTRAIRVIRG
jgi:hypothetical protein